MQFELLRKTHRLSAITLLSFIFFHFINHLSGALGAEVHIMVMNALRKVYHFWPVEVILLLSCLVQIASGILLAWNRRSDKRPFAWLQLASGLYLGCFLVYHVRAVMLGRYVSNIDTNFHFAAWGVKNYPAMVFFIPYYGLSIVAVFVHLACVHFTKMSKSIDRPAPLKQIKIQANGIIMVGIFLAAAIITILIIR